MEATCAHCNTAVNEGSKFCPQCGKPQPAGEKKCQGCGQLVTVEAAFCHNCGKSQRGVPPADKIAPLTDTLNLSCKKCGSQNVKRLSIAHAEGLSSVNLEHRGVGVGIGGGGIGLGVGFGDSKGTSQTQWSLNLAPPEVSSSPMILAGIAFLAGVVGIGLITVSLAATTLLGALAAMLGLASYLSSKENEKTRQEKVKWDSSFVCLRCGEIFIEEKEYERNREQERLRALQDSGDEIFRDRIVD